LCEVNWHFTLAVNREKQVLAGAGVAVQSSCHRLQYKLQHPPATSWLSIRASSWLAWTSSREWEIPISSFLIPSSPLDSCSSSWSCILILLFSAQLRLLLPRSWPKPVLPHPSQLLPLNSRLSLSIEVAHCPFTLKWFAFKLNSHGLRIYSKLLRHLIIYLLPGKISVGIMLGSKNRIINLFSFFF